MENDVTDKLSIERDALLKLKRLIDEIDKVRSISPKDKRVVLLNLHTLSQKIGITGNYWENFLAKAKEEALLLFYFVEPNKSLITLSVSEDYEDIAADIRKRYHKINDTLSKTQAKNSQGLVQVEHKENNYWKFFHPVWWIVYLLQTFRKYPKITLGIFSIIVLIGLIYFRGWNLKNINLFGIFEFGPSNGSSQ